MIESDQEAGRLRYSRVTPGSRAGTVTVRLSGERGGSLVEVAYDLTRLPGALEDELIAYSEENFAVLMHEWRELISASLNSDQQLDANSRPIERVGLSDTRTSIKRRTRRQESEEPRGGS